MTDEIFLDGVRYISAGDSATLSGFTRDYIARLCKDGKIRGRRVGKQWYANLESLQRFILEQEHARAKRREDLTQQRIREYQSNSQNAQGDTVAIGAPSAPTAVRAPIISRPTPSPFSGTTYAHAALQSAFEKGGSIARAHSARVAAHANVVHSMRHAPVHALAPGVDFLHKLIAGSVAVLFTIGTYAFVDAQYSRIVLNSVPKSVVLYEGVKAQLAAAASDPLGTLSSSFARFAQSVNRNVNTLVYGIAFPDALTNFRLVPDDALATRNASVFVRVASVKSSGSTPSSALARSGRGQTNTETRILERVIETQRVVASAGGLTEEILNAKLAQLDSKLSSQILGIGAQTSNNTTQIVNNYAAVGGALRIDELDDIDIDDSDFTNGRITGSSVAATTLSASGATTLSGALTVGGATSLAGTTVTGDLTVTGTFTGAIASSGGVFGYITATSTTATSTIASGGLAIGTTTPSSNSLFTVGTSSPFFYVDRISGTIGIGTNAPTSSAALQIDSTTRAFLPPRMTTAQKNAIASAAAGLILYDSDLNKLNVYNGSAWKNVGSTEIGGEVTSGTEGSVLFIGDGDILGQDNANFSFSTSTNRLLTNQASSTRLSVFDKAYFGGSATSTFNSAGQLAIATSSPLSALSVFGNIFLEGTDRYLNFGTSVGTTSYGFRDSDGELQFKNNAGVWTDVAQSQNNELLVYLAREDNFSMVFATSETVQNLPIATSESDNGGWRVSSTTALTVPAGAGGTYVIGMQMSNEAGTAIGTMRHGVQHNSTYYYIGSDAGSGANEDTSGTVVLTLAAGDTLKFFTKNSGSITETMDTFSVWVMSAKVGTVAVDSDSLDFSKFVDALSLDANTSIDLSGNSLSIIGSGTFSAIRASSTQLSVFNKAYFGGSATSTFDSAGALSLAGIANSLLWVNSSGTITSTSTPTAPYFIATSTSVASTFPYASSTALTATNFFSTNGVITYASSTAITVSGTSFLTNIFATASSTIGSGAQTGGLTILGGATTTGNAYFAGNVGIGTAAPVASAVLQLDSTTRGFLPPRMTTAQKDAISSPNAGLVLYDSDLNKLNVYNGSAWKNVGSTEIGGEVTSGTEGSVLFIGDGDILAQDNANFSFATSTNRLFVTQASSSRLSVFDKAYFGGSATSTFDSTGALSLANISNSLLWVNSSGTVAATTTPTASYFIATSTSIASTFPYASSTALTATNLYSTNGSILFASSTAITVSGTSFLTGGYLSLASSTVVGNFTTTGNGTFGGTMGVTGASTFTGLGTFSNGFLSTASSTITSGLFSMQGGASTTQLTASSALYVGSNRWDNASGKIDGEQIADDTIDDDSIDLSDITLIDFTNDADFVTWTNATSTLWRSTGFLSSASSTITSGLFTAAGGASTTAFTVSGTGYFNTASTTNLTISGTPSSILSSNGTGAVGALTLGNGLSFSNNVLSSSFSTTTANTWTTLQQFQAGASTTQLSVFQKAYFGASATSTFDSTGALSLAGIANSLLWVNGSGTVTSTSTPTAPYFIATSTSVASSFPYASSTALTATNLFSTNGTITYASSTALTATNLFSTNGSILFASSTAISVSGTSFLTGGYLSLASSTVVGNFTNAGNATITGTMGVTGASTFTSLGTFSSGFLSNASSTITSGLFSMQGGASTTALTVSGTGFFGTASTTNLTLSGTPSSILSTNGTGAVGALTLGNGLSFSNNVLSSTFSTTSANTWTTLQQFQAGASTTQLSVFQKAYFGGSATTTIDSTGALSLAGIANSLLWVNSSGTVTSTSTPTASFFIATSTSIASTFPYASSTALTATTGYFTNLTLPSIVNGILAGNASGVISATSTPTASYFIATSTSQASTFPYASSTALTVSGTGYFGNGAFTGTSGTTTIAAGQGFTIGSTQFVLQQGSGNVGIGTTGPDSQFQVEHASASKIELSTVGFGVGETAEYSFSAGATQLGRIQMVSDSSQHVDMAFSAWKSNALTEYMRYDAETGNVGIGVTNPQVVFSGLTSGSTQRFGARTRTDGENIGGVAAGQVADFGGFYSTATNPSAAISFGSQGSTGGQGAIGFLTSPTDTLSTAPTMRMVITNAGNVGIGTAAPPNKLTVWGGGTLPSTIANVQGVFGETDGFANAGIALLSASGNAGVIHFGTDSSTGLGAIEYDNTSNSFRFKTNTSEKVRIDSSGNVGIGTTTPSSLLHLAASTRPALTIETVGVLSKGRIFQADTTSRLDLSQNLSFDGSNYQRDDISVGSALISMTSGDIRFRTVAAGANPASMSDRLYITNTGNVGIGTTGPLGKMQVVTSDDTTPSTVTAWDGRHFVVGQSSNTGGIGISYNNTSGYGVINALSPDTAWRNLVLQSGGGNVGIGTSTPSAKLSLSSTLQVTGFSNPSWGAGIEIGYDGTQGVIQAYDRPSATAKSIYINNGGGNVILGGNVGIGTTGPESKTQITGGGLCVGSDANCNTDNNTEGTVYAAATAMTVYDIAENYPTRDSSVGPADIVALDPDNGVFVKKADSTSSPQARILGVISGDPAVLLGGFNGPQFANERQVAVGLSGRIPVKVSLEGGEIAIGDHLSLSSEPGVAKKAADGEQSIGYALEYYGEAQGAGNFGTGTIQFFITHGNMAGMTVADLTAALGSNTAQHEGNIGTGTALFLTNLFARLTEWLGDTANGIAKIVVETLTAKRVQTDELCVGDTCVTQAQFLQMVQTAGAAASSGGSGGGGSSPSPAPAPTPEPSPSPTPEPTPPADESGGDSSGTPEVSPPAEEPPQESPQQDGNTGTGAVEEGPADTEGGATEAAPPEAPAPDSTSSPQAEPVPEPAPAPEPPPSPPAEAPAGE